MLNRPRPMRLRRSAAVFALVWALGVGPAVGATGPPDPGNGPVVCSGSACTVTATTPERQGTGGQAGSPPVSASPSTNGAPPGSGSVADVTLMLQLVASGATYDQVIDQFGRAPLIDPATGQVGWWLGRIDTPAGAAAPAGAAPLPSPALLAQIAVSRLQLPSPVVGTSPSGDQLVLYPTWLWVDRSVWGPVSATAQVPGLSVTATAVPVSAVWSMGTGQSVTCQGPGTPYVPGATDPAASSPDCGYTYARSSAGQPGERFAVSVTVSWRVSWAGGGQSGTVDGLSTRATVDLRVREVQAVIVNPAP